ncbi:MAG: DUF7453 family protein [Lacipirellulaceae bacterium]
MKTARLRTLLAVASLTGALAASTSQAVSFQFETVMVSGRPDLDPLGPGLGTGIDYGFAGTFSMNDAGQVAFASSLSGAEVSSDTDSVMQVWTDGVKKTIVRKGDAAPQTSAGVVVTDLFEFQSTANINNSGAVYQPFGLGGAGVSAANDLAAYLIAPNGTPSVLVREGSPAGSLSPITYGVLLTSDQPRLDDLGNAAFGVRLIGPGVSTANDTALFAGQSGSEQLVAREGDPAPAFGPGVAYDAPNAGRLAISMGRIAFVTNGNTSGDSLFFNDGGVNSLVARSGDVPAGAAGQVGFINRPQLNASGDTAFSGTFSRTGTVDSVSALYSRPDGASSISLVALAGAAAPGTPAEYKNVNSVNHFANVLTSVGGIAYSAELTGTGVNSENDRGIWLYEGSTTRLMVREGDAAGDLNGITIGAIKAWTVNDNHHFALHTELTGTGVDASNNEAVWWMAPNGALELVFRKGTLFDVDPSPGQDLRTIDLTALGGLPAFAQDGQPQVGALNNNNELVFELYFDSFSSSGIFKTTLVPEPASLALVAFGALSLGTVRRGRM